MEDTERKEIIRVDGIYHCPECGSRRILIRKQCVVYKVEDANSGKQLNPNTLKAQMSNREKAWEYDRASGEGVGCWNYECKKCGWYSGIYTE